MCAKQIIGAVIISCCFVLSCFGEEVSPLFRPAVFWADNSANGVLAVSPNEMVVIDSQGKKLGIVVANSAVTGAYLSPDGKKVLYTTSAGVWLAVVASGENKLILNGYCDYVRWNLESSHLLLVIYEKKIESQVESFSVKVFGVDGDGKNLKQVYP